MLLNLSIRDYALIDNLSISFGPGLNILTGETGAGKSIIIDAVNLIIGERASTDFIRTGSESASVEAVFDYKNPAIEDILTEYGIDAEDDTLIISREVNKEGRSFARVNGRLVPVGVLKKIGKLLIDIHGQHEHQALLDSKNHLNILDSLGSKIISDSKEKVSELYKKYRQINSRISTLEKKYLDFSKQQEILKFEIDELDKAQLLPDEDILLEEEKKVIENAEKIFSALEFAYTTLYQNYEIPSINDNLSKVIDSLEDIKGFYKPIENILESLKNILYELEDISFTIRELKDSVDFDAEKLNTINERLELINRLKLKYGKTIPELLDYKANAIAELDNVINTGDEIKELKIEYEQIKKSLAENALELSKKRKVVAEKLEQDILKELSDLGMKNVNFKVHMGLTEDPKGIEIDDKKISVSEDGIDNVEFLISTNYGEPLKPLAKIISGGESSRIMLALKSIIAEVDNISCMIFDEIDAGIGGRTAQAVGEKLSKISRTHQILCVTHSPQIASLGDTHFLIKKESTGDTTVTKVYKIDGDKRVDELARMLGGAKITDNTIAHAKEMLAMAKKIKGN